MAAPICFLRETGRTLGKSPLLTRLPASTSTPTASVKPRLISSRYFSQTCPAYISENIHGTPHSLPLKLRLPLNAWDGHMHVVDPRYLVATDAVYQPTPHTFDQAIAFESSLGIKNLVLVQPSVYGFDNSCLLDALRRIGSSRGRGVVVIDPVNIENKTLVAWHALGVRGLRVNLKSVGKVPSQTELERILVDHARIARPLGWMIQIYMSLHTVPMLEQIVPQLGVKICLDHFGGPDIAILPRKQGRYFDPYSLAGFSSLIALLRTGNTYVKISAPYRLSKNSSMCDLESMIRVFLHEAPRQVIYGTDWPHTRFSGIDIQPFTELCLRSCDFQPGLAERLFGLNINELMDNGL